MGKKTVAVRVVTLLVLSNLIAPQLVQAVSLLEDETLHVTTSIDSESTETETEMEVETSSSQVVEREASETASLETSSEEVIESIPVETVDSSQTMTPPEPEATNEREVLEEQNITKEQLPKITTRGPIYDDSNAVPLAIKGTEAVVGPTINAAYSKVKLGYQLGAVVSWKVNADTTHYGTDMMGAREDIRYTGRTEITGNITKTTADGTIRFNYNSATKTASLTRLKNALTTLESDAGLTYSYQGSYAFRAWERLILNWYQVEDRFGVVNAKGKLSKINLETPPKIIAKPVSETLELEQNEELDETPAAYVTVSNKMSGGLVSYEWLVKPEMNVIGKQIAKVRVTDTLGSYRSVTETDIPFEITEPGKLSILAPNDLNFENYQVNGADAVVKRKNTNWSLVIQDTRKNKENEPQSWQLTAKAEESANGLENYLYYIDQGGVPHSLLETTTIIKEGTGEETTVNWQENQGIVLQIPAKNKLTSGQAQQTRIIWNINEGP